MPTQEEPWSQNAWVDCLWSHSSLVSQSRFEPISFPSCALWYSLQILETPANFRECLTHLCVCWTPFSVGKGQGGYMFSSQWNYFTMRNWPTECWSIFDIYQYIVECVACKLIENIKLQMFDCEITYPFLYFELSYQCCEMNKRIR